MTYPSEHQEQVAVVCWLEASKIPFFAVPNGGHRNPATAARLKAEGVRRGAPDLLVFLPDVTVALEMKARDSSRVSAEQAAWLYFLNRRECWVAVVAHGAEEAINKLNELLAQR